MNGCQLSCRYGVHFLIGISNYGTCTDFCIIFLLREDSIGNIPFLHKQQMSDEVNFFYFFKLRGFSGAYKQSCLGLRKCAICH